MDGNTATSLTSISVTTVPRTLPQVSSLDFFPPILWHGTSLKSTFQYRTVFDFIAVSVAAVTVIVVVVVAAASGEDRHSGYKGQRVEFPFHCFHNSIVLVVISNLSVCHSD